MTGSLCGKYLPEAARCALATPHSLDPKPLISIVAASNSLQLMLYKLAKRSADCIQQISALPAVMGALQL